MGERVRIEQELPAADRTATSGRGDPAGLTRAYRLYWLAFGLFLIAVVVGLSWDRAWHATHAFDTFYSLPHLFVYSTTAFTAGLIAILAFSPGLRVWFGPPCPVFPFPFAVPGALTLLGGGFATLGLAGALDDVWHSSFGLDETGWSFPHAMIGWGLLLIVLGFVAARLALRPYRPIGWATTVLLALLVLSFSITPFLGPLHGNRSPEAVEAVAAIPVLAVQPAAQHTFRIYLARHLDRTNPIALPLGALWAGAALAFVRLLTRRAPLFLAAVAVWSMLTTLNDRAFARRLDPFDLTPDGPSIGLALLSAAVALVMLLGVRLPERSAWTAAGLLFGLVALASFAGRSGEGGLFALVAAPGLLLGSRLGGRAYVTVEQRTGPDVQQLVAIAGLAIPFLFGLIDLYLRHVTA